MVAALALAILLAGPAAKPGFKKVWSIRLQSEIKTIALDERRIYFGTNDGYGAIDQSTGRKIWSKTFALPQLGAYVAQNDGKMFAEIGEGKLVAMDAATGNPLWSLDRTGYAGPINVQLGQLYAELKTGSLSSIDVAAHKPFWTAPLDTGAPTGLGRGVTTRPIVFGDTVLVGTKSGSVYALARGTGKVQWRYNKADASIVGLNLDRERVYAAYDDGAVIGISLTTGQKMWAYYSNAGLFGNPLIDNGRLFLGSTSGSVIGVAATDGKLLWKTPLTYQVNIGISQPIAWGPGLLLANRTELVGVALDGNIAWHFEFGEDLSGRAPRVLGNDLLLTSSHALYRVSVSGLQ